MANCSKKLNQDIELSVHEKFMNEALRLARKAASLDEVPIGCVIVKENQIIGRGFNEREVLQKSTAHSEIIAIEQACKQTGFWRLDDCDLYVTLEPCPMCAGAIIQSRIRNVYFGAYDPKGGSCGSVVNLFEVSAYNHHPNYQGGILEQECGQLLSDFFRNKRKLKKAEKLKTSIKSQKDCIDSQISEKALISELADFEQDEKGEERNGLPSTLQEIPTN